MRNALSVEEHAIGNDGQDTLTKEQEEAEEGIDSGAQSRDNGAGSESFADWIGTARKTKVAEGGEFVDAAELLKDAASEGS